LCNNATRGALIDKIASLVDENLCGRSEMCIQFAILLDRALQHLGLESRSVRGKAIYFSEGIEIFRWEHAWVRIGSEVIDANVDILEENPMVPQSVRVAPYWGPIISIPQDRRLRENHGQALPSDTDIDELWWPDLIHINQANQEDGFVAMSANNVEILSLFRVRIDLPQENGHSWDWVKLELQEDGSLSGMQTFDDNYILVVDIEPK